MLILAVAGEGQSLARAEFRAVAETVVERNAGRIPVILSVTSADPAERRWRAGLAREIGADIMPCQPPTGLAGDDLRRVFSEIVEVGRKSLMIQDLDWQGSGMAFADIVQLQEHLPASQYLKLATVPAGPTYTPVMHTNGGSQHD